MYASCSIAFPIFRSLSLVYVSLICTLSQPSTNLLNRIHNKRINSNKCQWFLESWNVNRHWIDKNFLYFIYVHIILYLYAYIQNKLCIAMKLFPQNLFIFVSCIGMVGITFSSLSLFRRTPIHFCVLQCFNNFCYCWNQI